MSESTAETSGEPMSGERPSAPARRGSLLKIAIAVAALIALVAVARGSGLSLESFAAWVDGLGVWGPVVFIAGYAVATVAFVPGSLLTLAGGAIFGLGWGTLYVFAGATIGSILAFLVARYVARAAIEKKVEGMPRFATIDRAIGREGRKIVFLLRLSPVFPFVLLNYALGLTRVRLIDYAIAAIGMLPGTLLYVYYGKLAGDVVAVAKDGAPAEKGVGYWVVMGLGLLATLLVTTVVTRLARRALSEDLEPVEGGRS
ncbi:MAG TPA: TVP38/TMEM64 family protein [Thermoanaerobaculia bacterium]|nr:TVP38/TMEM64 family protein [Thermoanaerobaculia bacterium]